MITIHFQINLNW